MFSTVYFWQGAPDVYLGVSELSPAARAAQEAALCMGAFEFVEAQGRGDQAFVFIMEFPRGEGVPFWVISSDGFDPVEATRLAEQKLEADRSQAEEFEGAPPFGRRGPQN